jgi:hypothetical protein
MEPSCARRGSGRFAVQEPAFSVPPLLLHRSSRASGQPSPGPSQLIGRGREYGVLQLLCLSRLTPPESPINSSGYGVFGSGSPETIRTLSAYCGRVPWAFGLTERVLQAGGDHCLSRKATQDNLTPSQFGRRALGPRSRCRGEHTLATADGYRPTGASGPPAFAFDEYSCRDCDRLTPDG